MDGTEVISRSKGSAISELKRLSFSATDHVNSHYSLAWARFRKYAPTAPGVSVGLETDGNGRLVPYSSASLVSSAFDTGEFSSFQMFSWDGEVPG